MTRPILDKAEVALEYPDKFYAGTFERSSRFEATMDRTGVLLILERPGAEDVRKSVHIHLNFGLFADILKELALHAGNVAHDDVHFDAMTEAATLLRDALARRD